MIHLSRLQRKNADRLAGIELILPWPPDIPAADLDGGSRGATPRETAAAWSALAGELERHGMTILDVAAIMERRGGVGRPLQPWLAVHVIGARWEHARRSHASPPPPITAWAHG